MISPDTLAYPVLDQDLMLDVDEVDASPRKAIHDAIVEFQKYLEGLRNKEHISKEEIRFLVHVANQVVDLMEASHFTWVIQEKQSAMELMEGVSAEKQFSLTDVVLIDEIIRRYEELFHRYETSSNF